MSGCVYDGPGVHSSGPLRARGLCNNHYSRAHRLAELADYPSYDPRLKSRGQLRRTRSSNGSYSVAQSVLYQKTKLVSAALGVDVRICVSCGGIKCLADFGVTSARSCQRCRRLAKYNLTGLDADILLRSQRYVCPICKGVLTESGWHTDHDHSCCPGDTSCGICVRGLIHGRCNVLLGMAVDNVDTLRNAISYLEASHGPC